MSVACILQVIAERRRLEASGGGGVAESQGRADLLSLLVNEGSLSDEDIRSVPLTLTLTLTLSST